MEDVIPMANRLVILDHGTVIADSRPEEAFEILRSRRHPMLHSMPTPMRIWSSLNWDTPCPLTVSDGRSQLTSDDLGGAKAGWRTEVHAGVSGHYF